MIRDLCALSCAAMCVCAACAQCAVVEFSQLSPVASASVEMAAQEDASKSPAVRIDLSDMRAVERAVAQMVKAGDYRSLSAVAKVAIESNDMRALEAMMLSAVESRDFFAVDAIAHAALDRWEVMRGFGESMSFISATCRRGRYLESIGADTSAVWSDLMKAIKMMQDTER